MTPQCPVGSLGGGEEVILKTLMINGNGRRPKCAPDVMQKNDPFVKNCFTRFLFKVNPKNQVLIVKWRLFIF